MKKHTYWVLLGIIIMVSFIGCKEVTPTTESTPETKQQDYPMVQDILDNSIQEMLAVLDNAPMTRMGSDNRWSLLENFIVSVGSVNTPNTRSFNHAAVGELSEEDEILIDSLLEEYPEIENQLDQILDHLDYQLENLPPIEVEVYDYDDEGNIVGEPYTVVSEDGILNLGIDIIPVAEYVLQAQTDGQEMSRGFVGQRGYGTSYWKNKKVSYFFSKELSSNDKTWFNEEIKKISKGTKITFEENKNTFKLRFKYLFGGDYLRITKKDIGTTPAQVNGVGLKWRSTLTINKDTFNNKGNWYSIATIHHEIGHVLGLLHEHQRADRDLYVYVKAKPGSSSSERKNNYDKIQYTRRSAWCQVYQTNPVPVATTFNTPFDYNSVMIFGLRKGYGVWRKDGKKHDESRDNKENWGDVNGGTFYTPWDLYVIKRIYGIPVDRPNYTPQ